MSRLNLHCELCGRRQADGLLSRAAWGQVEISAETILRACPTCRGTYPDWESQLRASLNGSGAHVKEGESLTS